MSDTNQRGPTTNDVKNMLADICISSGAEISFEKLQFNIYGSDDAVKAALWIIHTLPFVKKSQSTIKVKIELARPVVDPPFLAFRTRVLVKLLLEAVLAQCTLPRLPRKIKTTANMGAGAEACVTFVEYRWDSAAMEGEKKDKPAESTTDDSNTRLNRSIRRHA